MSSAAASCVPLLAAAPLRDAAVCPGTRPACARSTARVRLRHSRAFSRMTETATRLCSADGVVWRRRVEAEREARRRSSGCRTQLDSGRGRHGAAAATIGCQRGGDGGGAPASPALRVGRTRAGAAVISLRRAALPAHPGGRDTAVALGKGHGGSRTCDNAHGARPRGPRTRSLVRLVGAATLAVGDGPRARERWPSTRQKQAV